MNRLIGIFSIIIILFNMGFSYFTFSASNKRVVQAEKLITLQARNIEGLQKKLDALIKDAAFSNTSENKPVDSYQDGVETTLFDDKLTTLESEMAINRALIVDAFKSQSQMQNTGMRDEAQHGNDGWTQEQADAAREKAKNQLRQLDELIANEKPDPAWSGVMVNKIENLLNQAVASADSEVAINSYDCKSTLCRVETLTKGEVELHDIENALLESMDEGASQMITTRNDQENGDVITTFYLIKDGESLEQMLSAG